MNDLLAFAIRAHGGIRRWHKFSKLAGKVSIDGALWELRQQPGLLSDKCFEIETHNERMTIAPFGAAGQRSVFIPGLLVIENLNGALLEERHHPETTFKLQEVGHPWDRLQVAFFASLTLWTSLTSPFIYTYPGFNCEEIEPWNENGEIWRRLKVIFPNHVTTHTKTQITHFGPDGLMRRHDCTFDILDGNKCADYVSDYRKVRGLMMPMTRRIYSYDDQMRVIPEHLQVAIDFSAMTFS